MHVVPLTVPPRDGEDQLKDIDFTPTGIRTRFQSGLEEGKRVIRAAPWQKVVDPMEGVVIHDLP